jgi:FlaA1/EpsC-like NDP-sugar epimerase/lipopolysaccharide/colanic/teichoic acid biosynthesis glycosyltransferase
MLKRSLDLALSIIGIILLLPFFPIISLLIKLNTKGPVFFLCDRIGKDGKLFQMYKFRTMYTTPLPPGPSVCPEGDPRVTSVGRFLRRTKVNEFPQLINVLKGDMTLVGPRPEAPDLAALYPAHAQAIFTVKPGLVGPNQILGRNEEEWYPLGVDPQQYYIEAILPKKLPVDLDYVQQSSAFTDLQYIILGVRETLFKALNWNLVLQNRSQLYLLCADTVLCLVSFALAYTLQLIGPPKSQALTVFLPFLAMVVLIRVPCLVFCGLYSTLIRHLSFHDVAGALKGVTAGSLLLVVLSVLISSQGLPPLVFLLDWLCLVFFMSFMRLSLRFYWDWHITNNEQTGRRVLIFGAGDAGVLAYHSLLAEKETPFEVVGFLDDDPAKRHKTLYGKKVLGNRFNLEAVVKLYQVDSVFLAMPSTPFYEVAKIIRACQTAGVDHSIFPTLKNAFLANNPQARYQTLTELIETQDIQLDVTAVKPMLQGRRVLLTGACGELGVELCQQILGFSPQQLIIIDRYEAPLTELVSRLKNSFPDSQIRPVLCGPMSRRKIADVFRDHQPHIVFHTATRKYLPSFDIPVEDILRVNYLSTFELAKQAARCGSEQFIMLSSVEAKRQNGPISESLRAAEISLQQFFTSKPTRFATVRLCDILENRGSVVATLKEQITHLEPVTLPHPDATCHVLSKQAAAHFILNSLVLTASNPSDEPILLSAEGSPVLLLEIAQKLAAHNGLQLDADLPLRFARYDSQGSTPVWADALMDDRHILAQPTSTSLAMGPDHALTDTPEVAAAINYLLNMREQDLEHNTWAQHTHAVLSPEGAA